MFRPLQAHMQALEQLFSQEWGAARASWQLNTCSSFARYWRWGSGFLGLTCPNPPSVYKCQPGVQCTQVDHLSVSCFHLKQVVVCNIISSFMETLVGYIPHAKAEPLWNHWEKKFTDKPIFCPFTKIFFPGCVFYIWASAENTLNFTFVFYVFAS